ncbi:Uncharacterised protein [Pantoea agglomerans]|uniref:Uncharacterized protein n=1 Tax=Enterobacter agglomerans TaxID=549 RepID=A0A379AFZ2_ENTAG|nr:Uncharacterised protein [Pantoea agglomerans]
MLSDINHATAVDIVEPGNVTLGVMLIFDAQNRRLTLSPAASQDGR